MSEYTTNAELDPNVARRSELGQPDYVDEDRSGASQEAAGGPQTGAGNEGDAPAPAQAPAPLRAQGAASTPVPVTVVDSGS